MPRFLSELFALVETNLKIRYRQTFIGFLWVLANPILLFSVQMFLFSHLLQRAGSSYYLYLFTGLLPWFYLTQTAEMGCSHLTVNSQIMRNLGIHPYKLIWSLAIENYINFLSYSVLIFIMLNLNYDIGWLNFMMYLFFSFWLVFVTAHLSFVVALLNVLLKDTRYILHFIFTIFYFLTPSFYFIENIPIEFQFLVRLNPFYWLISLFRISVTYENVVFILAVNVLIGAVVSFFSFWFWKKYRSAIYLKL